MKIGDKVHIKMSFEHGLGRYKGLTAKIIGRNPYHEKSWHIQIDKSNIQIHNVKEKDLESPLPVWSVS